jgi:predicted AlkP superfamily phosphohydrolase/phosphomutase
VVLGLDGTPFSLVRRLVDEGRMPNFAALLGRGSLLPMESVLPTVSSVAWASITTGCNPGKHNIFGFVDRVPQTLEMFIPTSRNLLAQTWIDVFSALGRRVFSMGVPSTYPPKPVNGILISGFLAPNLRKATYPVHVAEELEAQGYVIDVDAWQAHKDRDRFLDDVFTAFERRCEAIFRFLGRGTWDLFVAHIMDTDRLHHFLWGSWEDEDQAYSPWFLKFYDRVDEVIGEVVRQLDNDTLLMILSDHGFCRLKREVHLNHWLKEAGYLHFGGGVPQQIRDLAPSTRCYSLLPGRFYVSLRGQSPNGCVEPGSEYEALRREIAEALLQIREPESGERVIRNVRMREDLYSGPAFGAAPDFVAVPAEGYDLKGGFEKDTLLSQGAVNGTHTLDDAVFFVNRPAAEGRSMTVMDVMPTLLEALGLDIPVEVDGRPVRLGSG